MMAHVVPHYFLACCMHDCPCFTPKDTTLPNDNEDVDKHGNNKEGNEEGDEEGNQEGDEEGEEEDDYKLSDCDEDGVCTEVGVAATSTVGSKIVNVASGTRRFCTHTIDTDERTILSLPDEILMVIMKKVNNLIHLYNFAASHPNLWNLFNDHEFVSQQLFIQSKKQYLQATDDKLHAKIAEAIRVIQKVIEHAPKFVHKYSTCINEGINSWRTKDLPK